MSDDPLKDLRAGLVRAARNRDRPWWRRRPLLLGAAAVLVVAAPATAAIDGLWRPDVAPMAPMRTVAATPATPAASPGRPASTRAGTAPKAGARAATTAACAEPPPSGSPRTTSATPPAAMLRALGVLRSPATAADRAGRRSALALPAGRVAPRAIRLLGTTTAGQRVWLVPSLIALPARPATGDCPARPAVRRWLLSTVRDGGGATTDLAEIMRRGTLGSSGSKPHEADLSGVVPDGVASVRVDYGDGRARTWPVSRNFFAFRVGLPVEQAYQADITWNDARGRPIKRIPAASRKARP